MGYYFEINGDIQFEDKRAFNIMKYLHKEAQSPFDEEIEGFEFKNESMILRISISIKNYNEYIEKLCLLAYSLDKKVSGEIDAVGEDSNDKFSVSLSEKGVKIMVAETIWKTFKGHFEDEDTIKKAKALLKDKELDKKMIVSVLEDKK